MTRPATSSAVLAVALLLVLALQPAHKHQAFAHQSDSGCSNGQFYDGEDCVDKQTCNPGQYITDGGSETTDRECGNCDPASHFQNQANQEECKMKVNTCMPGKYVTNPTSTTSDRECGNCNPTSQYQNQANQNGCRMKENNCLPGKYVTNPSSTTSDRECGNCDPASQYQNQANQDGCKMKVNTCLPGKYVINPTSTTSDRNCQNCNLGTTWQDNSNRASCDQVLKCGTGHYSSTEPTRSTDRVCSMCPMGTSQSMDGFTGTECPECTGATYQDQTGQAMCKENLQACASGEYQSAAPTKTSNRICLPCGTGTSQSASAHLHTMCDACGFGKFQDEEGESSCKTCSGGQYQNQVGQTGCKECPKGKFSPSAGGARVCTSCTGNTYQNAKSSTGCKTCHTCPNGYDATDGCELDRTKNRVCTDLTDPVIILTLPNGDVLEGDVYTVEAGEPFQPLIFTATDTTGEEVMLMPPSDEEIMAINTDQPSMNQRLEFRAVDVNSRDSTRVITIVVVDNTAPEITFDPEILALEAGMEATAANYTRGVSIIDAVDGNLNDQLAFDASDVNLDVIGNYDVVYSMTGMDSSGNQADTRTRTARVRDNLAPVLTVEFPDDVEILQGNVIEHEGATEFTYPSASAVDTFEGDVDAALTASSDTVEVNSAAGTQFVITYAAADTSTNEATETFVIEIVDTTYPVLTVTGGMSTFHEAATEYMDQGATATDTLDNARELDVPVEVTSNLVEDTPSSVPMDFPVSYRACDLAGNCVEAQRTVTVRDTTPPEVSPRGPNPSTLEGGADFAMIPTFLVFDTFDQDPTCEYDLGTFTNEPLSAPQTFTITYNCHDYSRNNNSATREVTVVDTTPPEITLQSATTTVGDGIEWEDPGVVSAIDIIDRDVTADVTAVERLTSTGVPVAPLVCGRSSAADFLIPISPPTFVDPLSNAVDVIAPSGSVYQVEYSVTDRNTNTGTAVLTVNVVDNSPPVLTLHGDEIVLLEYGVDEYVEEGVLANDVHDGDITGLVCVDVIKEVTGDGMQTAAMIEEQAQEILESFSLSGRESFAIDSIGSSVEVGSIFVVVYRVLDRAGNPALGLRAVAVVDRLPPIITLVGDPVFSIPFGTVFRDPGAEARDIRDGNVTANIVVSGIAAIDTRVPGEYAVNYTVSDRFGNEAQETRIVVVEQLAFPLDLAQIGLIRVHVSSPFILPTLEETQAALNTRINDAISNFRSVDPGLQVQPGPVYVVILRTFPGTSRPPTMRRRADVDWIQGDADGVATIEFVVRDNNNLNRVEETNFAVRALSMDREGLGILASSTAEPSNSVSIPGVVVGVLAAIALICGISYYVFVYRPRERQKVLKSFEEKPTSMNPIYRSNSINAGGKVVQGGPSDDFSRPQLFVGEEYEDIDGTAARKRNGVAPNLSADFYDLPNATHRQPANGMMTQDFYDLPNGQPMQQTADMYDLPNASSNRPQLFQPDTYDLPFAHDQLPANNTFSPRNSIYSVPRNEGRANARGQQLAAPTDTYDLPNAANQYPPGPESEYTFTKPASTAANDQLTVHNSYDVPTVSEENGRGLLMPQESYDVPSIAAPSKDKDADADAPMIPVKQSSLRRHPRSEPTTTYAALQPQQEPDAGRRPTLRQPPQRQAANNHVGDDDGPPPALAPKARHQTLNMREGLPDARHPGAERGSRTISLGSGMPSHGVDFGFEPPKATARRPTLRLDEPEPLDGFEEVDTHHAGPVLNLGTEESVYGVASSDPDDAQNIYGVQAHPMDISVLPGNVGKRSRAEAEGMLAGQPPGTYLWRTRGSDSIALSLVGRKGHFEHHIFNLQSGVVLMNGKPTSKVCKNMADVSTLMLTSREFASSRLVTPVNDVAEC